MIKPQEVQIETGEGTQKTFIISKFPAIQGREIIAKYPLSAVPKLGDYAVNEETMLKLMTFVAVPIEGREPLALTTRGLIDNHVPDWETLARIELKMLEYNISFFRNGKASNFLELIAQKAQAWISRTLTGLSEQLSVKNKPH